MKRILILSAKSGAGHMRAAEALEMECKNLYPDYTVKNMEVLQFTPSLYSKGMKEGYENLAKNLPSIWGMIYNAFEKEVVEKNLKNTSDMIDKLNTNEMVKEILSFEPDAIICTHFMPARVLSKMRQKNKLNARLFVVVTDFDVHTMWVREGIDHFFVGNEAMKYALHLKTFGTTNVTVSGIPILGDFHKEYPSKKEMRKKLGIEDKKTVMLSAGGFGLIPIDEVIESLAVQIPEIQILSIAGKNESLKKDVDAVAKTVKSSIVSYGFVTNMHELMAASDVIITKSGGLTTSECLAMGLPMIILKPIPGQEERNATYVLEAGAGVWVTSKDLLVYKTRELLKDATRLNKMKKNAKETARPHAAKTIIDTVVQEIS